MSAIPVGPARFERRTADWLGVDDAVRRVLARARPTGPERMPILEALGRALAEDVSATATLPPWDNSAMDGYAVRAEDVGDATPEAPASLTVTGVSRAGEPCPERVEPGTAVRIMTGAPMPEGADTVIRVEDTDAEASAGRVEILRGRDRGRNVRSAGQDLMSGESLLAPGHTVTPGVVGLLAAAGREVVAVHRRPTVAILVTGDELRTPGRYDDVRAGLGIPDSNGPMLTAMVTAAGGSPVPLGIGSDDPAELARLVVAASDCDVLVTSGGASMGDADLVKRVLGELGFELDFWRVKMRPGSPFGFGTLPADGGAQPVFSLPGNPASAFVTFEIFVRPFLRTLSGHGRRFRPRIPCVAEDEIDLPAELTYFHRVRLRTQGGALLARLTGAQGSGLVSGLAHADGLAVLPPELPRVRSGDPIEVLVLEGALDDPGRDVAS